MDYNEYSQTSSDKNDNTVYSDDIEFLVKELNEMAHMAGRYDRGVQVRKAEYILRELNKRKQFTDERH